MSELMTTAEVARRLKVTTRCVLNWWHEGILPEPLTPTPHTPRWLTEDIERWIEGGCRPAQLKAYKRRQKRG